MGAVSLIKQFLQKHLVCNYFSVGMCDNTEVAFDVFVLAFNQVYIFLAIPGNAPRHSLMR